MNGRKFRDLLIEQGHVVMPGAYNAFNAIQIAKAGFPGVYISGAGLSNSLGVPDDGTLELEDFLYVGKWITQAVKIPVICDADTGFKNIEETVEKYIEAGFSGLHIEDQVFPKKCGHLPGKEVVEKKEMNSRIGQACRARDKHDPGFVIIARTDARGASNIAEEDQLNESIARGQIYLEAGADMIFPESLRTKEEFSIYREEVPGFLMANMTEFGKTPFIKERDFLNLGFKVVIFPVSLFRYHAGKTKTFLSRLKEDGNQEHLVPEMMSRSEINKFLNYEP
ncbi:MAG: oxaloacetate decarboxylase [Nitrospinales bacterium]